MHRKDTQPQQPIPISYKGLWMCIFQECKQKNVYLPGPASLASPVSVVPSSDGDLCHEAPADGGPTIPAIRALSGARQGFIKRILLCSNDGCIPVLFPIQSVPCRIARLELLMQRDGMRQGRCHGCPIMRQAANASMVPG